MNPGSNFRNKSTSGDTLVLGKSLLPSKRDTLPKILRVNIFIFHFFHYLLLFLSISMLVYRRLHEYNEILRIENNEAGEARSIRYIFYTLTGLIYARYNLEIINFICYKIFVVNLASKTTKAFRFKMTCEVDWFSMLICRWFSALSFLSNLSFTLSNCFIIKEAFWELLILVSSFLNQFFCSFIWPLFTFTSLFEKDWKAIIIWRHCTIFCT